MPTSPSADRITPGAWQGSYWSASFQVTQKEDRYRWKDNIRKDITLPRLEKKVAMKTPTMGGAGKGQAANSPDTDHKQEVTRTKGCSSPLVEPQSSSDPSQTPGSATTESHHPVDRGWAWVILLGELLCVLYNKYTWPLTLGIRHLHWTALLSII